PNRLRAQRFKERAEQLALLVQPLPAVVVVRFVVIGPLGVLRRPLEVPHRAAKVHDQPFKRTLAELSRRGRLGLLDRLVGVLHLTARVSVDMKSQPDAELRTPRKQPARQIEWYPVDVNTQQLVQPNVGPAHQRQRREEMLAKLSIRDPRLAFVI